MAHKPPFRVIDGVDHPPHPLMETAAAALKLALEQGPEALLIVWQCPDEKVGMVAVPDIHAIRHHLAYLAYDTAFPSPDDE